MATGYSIAKDYKPKWTIWSHREVREVVVRHKRYVRRQFKLFLRTGDKRHYERSCRLLTSYDFD